MRNLAVSESIHIHVPAVPVAQPRQRMRVLQVAGRSLAQNYTPTSHPVNEFKATVRMAASQAYSGPPITGPCRVDVVCVFPRESSKVWKTRPMQRYPHIVKPDLDNLLKSILDCLNQVLWHDDALVYQCTCTKLRAAGDEQPHCEITITQEVVENAT